MASRIYNAALAAIMNGTIDLNNSDLRVALVMTNTTADTVNDAIVYVGDIGTLDECDSSGYARLPLADESVAVVDGSDLAKFDATDLVFTGLGGDATRQIQGAVIYKHVSSDADSPVLAYIDFTAPLATTAVSVTLPWDAAGILTMAQA